MNPIQGPLHDRIKRSVVEIDILDPPGTQPGQEPFEEKMVYGTIVMLQPTYMYVVTNPIAFHGRLGCQLEITSHDDLEFKYSTPVIHLNDKIAGIYCPFRATINTSGMQAAHLCQSQVAKSQAVHVYTSSWKVLTSGNVMGISGCNFRHNCSAIRSSSSGAPVVDDNGNLVGICTDFRNDYLEAINISGIVAEIGKALVGRAFISVNQMLTHLQNRALVSKC